MSGAGVRDKLVFPVLVNILTAVLIFFSVVLLKKPIYEALVPGPELPAYPLHVTAEPVPDTEPLSVDLYVMNVTSKAQAEADLDHFIRNELDDGNGGAETPIRLRWRSPSGAITRIVPYEDYNRDKGEIDVLEPDDRDWGLRVRAIQPKAILRFRVETDSRRRVHSYAASGSVPFTIDYPGR